ncbi:TPA: YmiA family putative membrane protein [Enterobacter hormaechei subsp. xiangfangensis]|nr:YmiA family putative membrane protein [Enterobacter hormaechei subsp. xiangfangensis]
MKRKAWLTVFIGCAVFWLVVIYFLVG